MNDPVVIYPCEEGGFVAEIPTLKGCLAQGETIEDTFQELRTVLQLWIETAQAHHDPLPDVTQAIEQVKLLRGCLKSRFVGIKTPDPPSPLNKGARGIWLIVPLIKGDLGGSGADYHHD